MTTRATRIVLVRHGHAQCAADSVVGGPKGCTGLSADGRAQVERLRDRLERTGELGSVDVLLSSTLPRAIETAALLAPALGIDAEAFEQDCDLCELHVGEGDALPWTEWREKHGAAFEGNPVQPFAPGGESIDAFAQRVEDAMRRIAADHAGRTVVIACHGGFVAFSLIRLIGRQGDVHFDTENTAITEWHHDGTRWTLQRFNDHAHLTLP